MLASKVSLAVFVGLVEGVAAFSSVSPVLSTQSSRAVSLRNPRSAGILAGNGLRMSGQGASTNDWGEVPEGRKPFTAGEKTLDEWIETFKDPRNSIRTMAAMQVAAMHDDEGKGDEVVDRLIKLLTVEDMQERRTAVQCMGMIGNKVLKRITDIMLTTDDMTIRASCAKTIGAVALKNPENVPDFPQDALDAMKVAALGEKSDPVTRLAVMSGLSALCTGDNYSTEFQGCDRALDVILEISKGTDDVSLLLSCMNALGAVSGKKEEWKPKIIKGIEEVKESKKTLDGFEYVSEMIDTQLKKIQGEGAFGNVQALAGDKKMDNLAAMKKQMSAAFAQNFNKM